MHTATAQPPPLQQSPETAQVRVLIIDDNPSFRDLLSAALSTVDGIECVGAASSAAEGLQRVAELRPCLVVMDIMMPGLDGLSATRQLRQLSPGTAVAVVSAYGEGEWIARAADAGASAYIPKDGSLNEMVEVLRAARPGSMVVAPSLSSVWTAWNAAPEPLRGRQQPPGTGSASSPPALPHSVKAAEAQKQGPERQRVMTTLRAFVSAARLKVS
jgi:DNA-binding NarL/FixJ family response regulator